MQLLVRKGPRTSARFASLMELYESNYLLVRVLVPCLRSLPSQAASSQPGPSGATPQAKGAPTGAPPPSLVYVSSIEGCLDLQLGQVAHEKYTSTFNLTYLFEQGDTGRASREPDLMIRIYHDARTCEVMSGLLQGVKHGPLRTRDLDEGYRLNRFLQKWVRYCLRQGHVFKPGRFHTRLASSFNPVDASPAMTNLTSNQLPADEQNIQEQNTNDAASGDSRADPSTRS